MINERLRAAVAAAEQLLDEIQVELAEHIEALLPPVPATVGLAAVDFIVFADVPDDAVDVLDRMRHEVPPTPPYEEP